MAKDIEHDFLNVFSVQCIEVLGTDTYIKEYVTQNCIKIVRDVEKHDAVKRLQMPHSDGGFGSTPNTIA